jgi:hypothetical protein
LNRWRKWNIERGKFGVSFWHQIFDHVRAWIYVIGSSVFQLLIILLIFNFSFWYHNFSHKFLRGHRVSRCHTFPRQVTSPKQVTLGASILGLSFFSSKLSAATTR